GAVRAAVVHHERVHRGQRLVQTTQQLLDVLPLVVGRDHHEHAAISHAALLRSRIRHPIESARAAIPPATSTRSGHGPTMLATVVVSRSGSVPTRISEVNSSESRTTLPSGRTMALTPLVAATTAARPCSTARSRDIASCW